MSAKSDNRILLTKIVESLDAPDMKQIIAYAAGYEAGKLKQMSDVDTNTQLKCQPNNSVLKNRKS